MEPWQELESAEVADCAVFKVERSRVRVPRDGREHAFYRLHAPDWVHVVPVTSDGQVVLVRQWRHGSRSQTLEVPGGMVDAGETPAQAAARELLEETGFRAGRIVGLGSMNPNPALFANRLHTFAALEVERVAPIRNEGAEETEVELAPLAQVGRLVAEGAIDHALVVAGFALFERARADGRLA